MNNKKGLAIIIAAVAAVVVLIAIAVFVGVKVKRSDQAKAEPTGSVIVINGKTFEPPNPTNTVVLPPDSPLPPGEAVYVPPDKLPVQDIPPDSGDNFSLKTSGGMHESGGSKGTIICGPQPSPDYWVEGADGKLGDRTISAMKVTINPFKGDGTYTALASMAFKYPDGDIWPSTDNQAIVEIKDGGLTGSVRGNFTFKEGLVSLSLTYKCPSQEHPLN